MAEKPNRPTAATKKTPEFGRLLQIAQEAKLIDLDRPVGQFVGIAGRLADEFDGNLICWTHYMFIVPGGPKFEDIVGFEQQG